jgi:hypothetical protein
MRRSSVVRNLEVANAEPESVSNNRYMVLTKRVQKTQLISCCHRTPWTGTFARDARPYEQMKRLSRTRINGS